MRHGLACVCHCKIRNLCRMFWLYCSLLTHVTNVVSDAAASVSVLVFQGVQMALTQALSVSTISPSTRPIPKAHFYHPVPPSLFRYALQLPPTWSARIVIRENLPC